jgi:hypothetical protein
LIKSFKFFQTRMPRWLANLIGNSFRAEDTKSAIENLKLWGVFYETPKQWRLTQTPYSATCVRISSVCATFFEISNCDARSMLAERAASRRDESDQK